MNTIKEQISDLRAGYQQLLALKQTESAYQNHMFDNAYKVLRILEDKRKDFVLDSLTQIDASVVNLSTDVLAFKNIRNRLFLQIQDDIKFEELSGKTGNDKKMYLYLFHLFESVVSHTSLLVKKTIDITMSQISLPKDAGINQPTQKQSKEAMNTIVTDQSDFATIQQQNGFFSENIKQIFKQKHGIQRALD